MAYPQGIAFRGTAGYVTDAANYDPELPNGTNSETYPRTSAQGNTVGWETDGSSYNSTNRNDTNDPRIAGFGHAGTVTAEFRLDLPSTGDYNIGIAMGDAAYGCPVACDLYDSASSLGSLTTGTTSAAQRFKDATDTEYTQITWPTSQTLATKTFSTNICRFRVLGDASITRIASLYVESAAVGGPTPVLRSPIQSNMRWR